MTPLQERVLSGLERLLDLSSPDIRIGQQVAWLGELSQAEGGRGIWDIEDEELLPVIERFRKDLAARFTNAAESA